MKIRTFLFSLAAMLLAVPAFAQTPMPARQVSVNTNDFGTLSPASPTVQSTLDWVDDNWPGVDSSGWSVLSPEVPNSVQSAFNWLDENLVLQLNTNLWTYLLPTGTTTQAGFDATDAALALLNTSLLGVGADVDAHAEQLADIDEQLQGFVLLSELCDLVAACSGTTPTSGDDIVFYGIAAYTPQEFTVTTNMESLTFHATAAGGNSPLGYGVYGGAGAYLAGTMSVDTNDGASVSAGVLPTGAVVRAYVGTANFGYNGESAAGGRATRVDVVFDGATNLLFIAGGGGGCSPYGTGTRRGGAGGAPNGYPGTTSTFTDPDFGGPLVGRGGTGGVGSSSGGSGGAGSISGWTHPLCTSTLTRNGAAGALYTSTSAASAVPFSGWVWASLQVSGTACASDYPATTCYGAGNGGEGYYGGGDGGVAVATREGYRNGMVIVGAGGGGSSHASALFPNSTNESTGTYAAYTNFPKYVSGYGAYRQPGILVVEVTNR